MNNGFLYQSMCIFEKKNKIKKKNIFFRIREDKKKITNSKFIFPFFFYHLFGKSPTFLNGVPSTTPSSRSSPSSNKYPGRP